VLVVDPPACARVIEHRREAVLPLASGGGAGQAAQGVGTHPHMIAQANDNELLDAYSSAVIHAVDAVVLDMMLPELGPFKILAISLQVRFRIEIANGNFDLPLMFAGHGATVTIYDLAEAQRSAAVAFVTESLPSMADQLKGVGFGSFETVEIGNLDLSAVDFKSAGRRSGP
jgi:CheY-like chemotaxis protein